MKEITQNCITVLPEDEHLDARNMSKTTELNYKSNVKRVHFVGSYYRGL